MKVAVWIAQILTGVGFLMLGFMRLGMSKAEMLLEGMKWAKEFSPTQIKIIIIVEMIGALGVLVPIFVKSLQRFIPLAAAGLALMMVGAMGTHIMINDTKSLAFPLIFFALSAFTAYGRKDLMKK